MVRQRVGRRTLCGMPLIMAGVLALAAQTALAQPTQLDETWTVTINGQSVPVNANGSFFIPNVAAPDLLPPASLSDDFITLTAVGTWQDTTYYAYSTDRFQITQGETFTIDSLEFSLNPPPMPESITLSASKTLLEIGQPPAVLEVLADIPGQQDPDDVTLPGLWTTYRTSNPAIATVDFVGGADPMMVVSAHAVGVAFITAVNGGATSVVRIDITASIVNTTIQGFVHDDGSPVVGAEVVTCAGSTTSQAPDGYFELPLQLLAEVPVVNMDAFVGSGSERKRGSSGPIAVVADGITDVGIIVLRPEEHLFGNLVLNAGVASQGVTVVDLDLDGDADIISAALSANNISILLNDGNGFFASSTLYPTGANPVDPVAVDLDGDSYPEVVVLNNEDDSVWIFPNNGDGTLGLAVSYAVGAAPLSVAVGFLDDDALPDLAIANKDSRTVSLLFNDGSGKFSIVTLSTTPDGPCALPIRVAVGDFNGDFDEDLAVARDVALVCGSLGHDVLIFENDGDGIFSYTAKYDIGDPSDLVVSDVDHDSHLDLVLSAGSSSTIKVFFNDGSGVFVEPPAIYDDGDPVGQLAVADVDGDGFVDLVYQGFHIRYNNHNNQVGTFSDPAVEYSASSSGAFFAVATGDLDGDKDIELVGSSLQGVSVLINEGVGVFSAMAHYPLPGISQAALDAADLNEDGATDVVVCLDGGSTEQVHVFLNLDDGTGLMSPNETYIYSGGSNLRDVAIGDVNGDMLQDVVLGVQSTSEISIRLGLGDGSFPGDVRYAAGPFPGAIDLADYDGANGIDVAVANLDSISILLNDGDGVFGLPIQSQVTTGVPAALVRGMIDGDSAADLAVPGPQGNLSIMLNQGGGVFMEQAVIPAVLSAGIALTHLDCDIVTDLVVAGGELNFFTGLGDGNFIAKGQPFDFSGSAAAIAAADFNLDGHLDIAVLTIAHSKIAIMLGRGDGSIEDDVRYYGPSAIGAAMAIADVDGDGDPDLLFVSAGPPTSASLRVLLNRTIP